MRAKLLKGGGVVLGAVLLSTLGIFASDGLRDIDGNVALLKRSQSGSCPAGMTPVERGEHSFCIDTYEVSPSPGCIHADPTSSLQTEANMEVPECYAASVEGATPWRFVSLQQAQRLCAAAGKRLPSNAEWYRAVLGTDSAGCVIDARNSPQETGTNECTSQAGVHDMVGNLWEWTDETVTGRTYRERELPAEGYVASVDADGVAVSTGAEADPTHGDDYLWSDDDGVHGMLRGGFYGSGSDAGLFALNASVEPSFASAGVGFRCVN